MAESLLHWLDYVVLAISLLLSVGIGIFYATKERKSQTDKTEQFLLAGRNMSVLPVSVSIFVSWLSAISILADPVEVYYYGIIYVYVGPGFIIACVFIAKVFVPFFHEQNITSAYQYIEARYHRVLRYITCVVLLICVMLYLGIVIYGPSVALSQVTGLSDWAAILLIGVIGTFYTTVGGMKAIVWVDTIQSIIMLAGMVIILIAGLVKTGGVANVLHSASLSGRLNYDKFDIDPLVRSTVWTYLIGGFFRVLLPYISSQHIIQRYLTVPTSKKSSMTVYLNIPMYFLFTLLMLATGLTMVAYYDDCDPLEEGRISSENQLLPIFMVDVLGFLPGMPGLFLSSLFAAALSTLSSAINSVAAIGLIDIFHPIFHKCYGRYASDRDSLVAVKLISICCGVFVISLAFATLLWGLDLYTMVQITGGIFVSPIAALFFMGKLLPFVHAFSACCGVVASLIISILWGLGMMLFPGDPQNLPVSTFSCQQNISIFQTKSNTSIAATLSETTVIMPRYETSTAMISGKTGFKLTDLSGTSPLWFGTVGFLSTVLVAVAVSAIKGIIRCCMSNTTVLQLERENADFPVEEHSEEHHELLSV